jgi:PAS domain S-box-containing protein
MSPEQRGTILIVDADTSAALLEQRRLERAGYVVVAAATQEEALQRLAQDKVDVILLDYRLPGNTDGLALYAQLKEAGFDLPVILVTSVSSEAAIIQAFRMGVRDFVTKSVEYLDYLPEAVERVLKQVRTEQQLAESEARLASIIATAKDAILVVGADRRITLFKAAAETMFRCPAAQAIGQPLSRFIPRDYSAAPGGRGPEAGQPPESVTLQVREGTRGVRADGEHFPLEASMSRVEVSGWKSYTVIVRDVTERKRLAAQLLHAQRMEGIGVLAGGVAHDFNNLLTIITGYSELLLSKVRRDDPSGELLREIRKAGERAAALTRQLLAFSRKQILAPQVLNVNVLVGEMEKMLKRLIGEDIDLASALDPTLGRVKADPGQIEQLILNLVVNARDAMPTGGRLTLETRNVELDRSYGETHVDVQPGPYVMLAVTDTGCGMDEATRAQIFEPFFTTKAEGKGTGLGLATVYGIVKQSGGHIEVYSEPGKGTSFKLYLPRLAEAVPSRDPIAGGFQVPRGTETILLAEDEQGVRSMIRLALEASGYTVLEARNGDEALNVCRQHTTPIHLLVTDVVMPGMSGRQLADLVAGLRPNLKVLYLSGYTDDAIVRHGVLESGMAFLQKPFLPTVLVRKVREVLDQAS